MNNVIDIFSAGNTAGIQDKNGIVQTGPAIIKAIDEIGNVVGLEIDEENKIAYFMFDTKYVVRIYGTSALESFWNLVQEYPHLFDKIKKQIKKANKKDTKKILQMTKKKVKRKNKYNRRIAKVGLAVVTSIMIGGSTISLISKSRSETDPKHSDVLMDDDYKMPEIDDFNNFKEHNEYVTVTEKSIEVNDEDTIEIEYEDKSNESRAILCKQQYYDKIKEYSNMYGIDPKIMLGIAIQERGTHSEVIDDSGAIGLMQIEDGVWNVHSEGAFLSAYNYKEQREETLYLPLPDIGNLDNNIKYACMIFQSCLKSMGGNVMLAIQAYNYGTGNMQKVLDYYCASTHISEKELLNDDKNVDWLNYRDCIGNQGDPNYVENVLGWIGKENVFSVKTDNRCSKVIKVKEKELSKSLT